MGEDGAAAMFGLLSDEIRVDILRAVAVAGDELAEPGAGRVELSFSELYDRVDVDGTSKLSYHLGELTGDVLRKGADGYALTFAGERLARFVLSGNYGTPPAFGPESVSGTCPFCESRGLEASLTNQHFRVECPDCERPVAGQPVTPAQAAAWDGDALLRNVERQSAAQYRDISRGWCPGCRGRLDASVRAMPESPFPDADPFIVTSRCVACLREYNGPLTYSVAYHPASVAFHWNRGVDVTTTGGWNFSEHLVDGRWTAQRVETEPDAYQVVLRHGDDALRARLDDTATVLRTERVRRDSAADRR